MNKNLETTPSSMLIAFAVVLLCLAHAMAAEKNEPAKMRVVENRKAKKSECNSCGEYVPQVPEFSLKDPRGEAHTSASLYANNGMLIMLTAPNLTQYEKQKRWEKYIAKQRWPLNNAPRRVLLEDLSQQETFKERVRSMMAEKYDPQGELMVIVDEDGAVRRRFGVQNNETVLLLVDASGKVIHHEADFVEPDMDSAKRLVGQVCELAESQPLKTIPPPQAKLIIAEMLPAGKN